MTLSMAMASAPSPPGRTRSQSSPAFAAIQVSLGSTTATFMPRFIRSVIQWP